MSNVETVETVDNSAPLTVYANIHNTAALFAACAMVAAKVAAKKGQKFSVDLLTEWLHNLGVSNADKGSVSGRASTMRGIIERDAYTTDKDGKQVLTPIGVEMLAFGNQYLQESSAMFNKKPEEMPQMTELIIPKGQQGNPNKVKDHRANLKAKIIKVGAGRFADCGL